MIVGFYRERSGLLMKFKLLSNKIFWNSIGSLLICIGSMSSLDAAEDRLDAAPENSFSIVVIPDTQAYKSHKSVDQNGKEISQVTNPIFAAHTDWIAKNLKSQKIVFVSHVGDIVDKNRQDQWSVARNCMDRIHGLVPYGISVGNHDMTSKGDSSLFQQNFPAARYQDKKWYGGTFTPAGNNPKVSGNNANSYQLYEAGGRKFLHLHLECNAPDDVLAWADSLFEDHSDRVAIVTTHMGLGPRDKPKNNQEFIDAPKGRMRWLKIHGKRGNTPEQMWEKCFSQHKNLFMICCGDQSRTQARHEIAVGVQGNTVHQLLSDYSTGWLRMYRFLPDQNEVQAITFDPRSEELCAKSKYVNDRNQHQFRFPLPE